MWKRNKSKILAILIGACLAPIAFLKPAKPVDVELYYKNDETGEYVAGCMATEFKGSYITAMHCTNKTLYFKSDNNYVKLPENSFTGEYSNDYFTGRDLAVLGKNEFRENDCGATIYAIDMKAKCDLFNVGDVLASTECIFPRGKSGKGFLNDQGRLCAVYSGYYNISSGDEVLRVAIFNRLSFKDNNNND